MIFSTVCILCPCNPSLCCSFHLAVKSSHPSKKPILEPPFLLWIRTSPMQIDIPTVMYEFHQFQDST
jgi:hypothetical protein